MVPLCAKTNKLALVKGKRASCVSRQHGNILINGKGASCMLTLWGVGFEILPVLGTEHFLRTFNFNFIKPVFYLSW